MANMPQAERMARVEVEVIALKESIENHKRETAKSLSDIDTKLDELLALRNKGAGAFWLISCLVGTGIIGMIVQFTSWVRS